MNHGQYHSALFASAMKPCPAAMEKSMVGLGLIRGDWRNVLVTANGTKHANAIT